MPTIEDYASLAPFTLEELVAAVNAILRGRPRLQTSERTVRYYISQALLPPPSGGPKNARYGVEHLRRIVAIREWIDAGFTLDQAAAKIKNGEHGGETETHRRQRRDRQPEPAPSRSPAPVRTSQGAAERTVRRFALTENSVLEVMAEVDLDGELARVEQALKDLRNQIQSR